MSKPVYFVAPWDLHRDLACVPDDPSDGSVLLIESVRKSRAMPYHRKKLVYVLSAMHHFAESLRADGYDVSVVNARSFVDGVREHVQERGATEVIAMEPREWGLSQAMHRAKKENTFGVPVTLHESGGEHGHFLITRAEFLKWCEGRRVLRMVDFYRLQRKRTGYLMDEAGKPLGGKYSFDAENRKHARGQQPPVVLGHTPSAITRAQMERVREFKNAFGEVDGFAWPVTREAALAELDRFFEERSDGFGTYQDAMLIGEPTMWHSLISAALNVSLVSPREVCDRVAAEVASGRMPLASGEGLLRQVLGWREFIRGIYWMRMPMLRDSNLLGAKRKLPVFYWEPEKTEMTCMRESVSQVRDTGYAHHIQRLMVQGNFALLAGIDPLEISHWFWSAFVDAYEWVELPNVHGMAVYADDSFTTKPYAASGSYINKMSDYCRSCHYDVKKRVGEDACPFNAMYWAFMDRHRERLQGNHRMRMTYRTWDKFSDEDQRAIVKQADAFLATLEPATEPWTFDDDLC